MCTVQPRWVCRGFRAPALYSETAVLQGGVEEHRGSHCGVEGGGGRREVGAELGVQPSEEGHDKLIGMNDTAGNHCV